MQNWSFLIRQIFWSKLFYPSSFIFAIRFVRCYLFTRLTDWARSSEPGARSPGLFTTDMQPKVILPWSYSVLTKTEGSLKRHGDGSGGWLVMTVPLLLFNFYFCFTLFNETVLLQNRETLQSGKPGVAFTGISESRLLWLTLHRVKNGFRGKSTKATSCS